ncbi:23S rRNA pseudouridine(955/2504/2580) synthase RluC [Cellvibrio sp. OA-2007]|uniref:23S rRNA pseudouridine(955/2504/2580) synthase RluC n=1 Tax=Cellvibrio sp. OA-2007 TaxID=529823 RepID=UPI0007845B1F|nr:23S rRNA pseudouridine(955/2504/2580) synthase RluC [Cellvibrio sp. OA-2007]
MKILSEKTAQTTGDSSLVQVTILSIDADQAGQRLDNFLIARLKGVPKSKIYNVIRKGEVRVNKGRIKPEYKLVEGDSVRVPPIRTAEAGTEAKASHQMMSLLAKSILFEDDGLLVINKPPGLAVHGGSGITLGLIETLRQVRPEARHLELVHRLDRDTSGCIMVAKKRSYLRHLQAALREKSAGAGGITKVYQALVVGDWPRRIHQVNAPLLKTEVAGGERVVRVHPEGKPSLTEFKVLQRFDGFSLIEARPITGRTHQIRVHAQYAGCCLVGDEKYGNDEINAVMREKGVKRLFLHASALSFYLPESEELTHVEAPLLPDLSIPLGKLSAI